MLGKPKYENGLRFQSRVSLIVASVVESRDVLSARQNRQLLRDRFMVELVEGSRKLRHVFLFTDLLLCAKLKKQAAG